MKAEFLNHISLKKLCSDKDKILLTVSGGIDSMVMLHLFHECGFTVNVAHVNFQLRGAESNEDEEFVKKECEKFSIPPFIKRFNTDEFAKNNSLSIQMAARELRFDWFKELAEQYNFDFVATAHHLNDSIETVLLNLARGSGLDGLDGIESKNEKIIRPLLFATRQQIENYAKENNIAWREDSSNASDNYQRNFIRHKIIPLLKEVNPSLEDSFTGLIDKVAAANEFKELGIHHWREEFETRKNGQTLLDKKGFQGFKNTEGLLWNLIKHFGFNIDQCKQIIKSLHGQSGKKFYAHEFELIIDREHLVISMQPQEFQEIKIEQDQTEIQRGASRLKISQTTEAEFSTDNSVALVDSDKLQFPLTWRKWKAGDYFYPLGMPHKKKLSDFFIDQKISVADKETITVLESSGEIFWIVGYRINDTYKISNSTKRILKFELTSSQ